MEFVSVSRDAVSSLQRGGFIMDPAAALYFFVFVFPFFFFLSVCLCVFVYVWIRIFKFRCVATLPAQKVVARTEMRGPLKDCEEVQRAYPLLSIPYVRRFTLRWLGVFPSSTRLRERPKKIARPV